MFYTFCLFTDVDVAEPDERSLITYVASLYDVFPDVPRLEQSLADNVSKQRGYMYWRNVPYSLEQAPPPPTPFSEHPTTFRKFRETPPPLIQQTPPYHLFTKYVKHGALARPSTVGVRVSSH